MGNLLKNFTVTDNFIGRYEKLVKEVVIPYQKKILNDEIIDAEKSHAIENFRAAGKLIKTGKCDEDFYGMVFQDSDVAKWLEACAYSLLNYPDSELENRCDSIIEIIEQSQHEDGYLNTYFTVKEPEKRWTNLAEAHELYCAGHMMEAAVAYAKSTGKKKLLEVMCKMADHMYKHFIVEHSEGYPGHPEVELALMKMYRCTNNKKYKELAEHFINVRGVDSDYFIKERQKNNWTVWGSDCNNKEYAQNHAPVRKQTKAVGHAVRAVYLYTGMADVAYETNDKELKRACEILWENITQCRMYVTGGIGSAYEGEAFTKDYHLPNDTAYAETCAAIGLIFFARKMLNLEKKSAYADTMERALYNCVLAGIQLDGKKFFYVNPLEVIPGISGEAVTHRHTLPQRPNWFLCACCPPNVARLLSSLGKYAWSKENTTVYSHLFIGGTLKLNDTICGKIMVETEYPYSDKVIYRFAPDNEHMPMTLAIRLPQWSHNTVITLNDKKVDCPIDSGYAYLSKSFTSKDELVLSLDMSVKRIFSSPKVSSNSSKVTFSRGPLIYCAEGTDNNDEILSLKVKKDSTFETRISDKLGGIVEIITDGYKITSEETLYTSERPQTNQCKVILIPYYTWGNRGPTQMRVWIPEM